MNREDVGEGEGANTWAAITPGLGIDDDVGLRCEVSCEFHSIPIQQQNKQTKRRQTFTWASWKNKK